MRTHELPVLVPFLVAMLMVVGALVAGARRGGLGLRVALTIAAWLTLTWALASAGVFSRFDVLPPRVLIAAMVAVTGILLSARTEVMRGALASVPAAAIVALQTFRLPVELGLHALYTRGAIPVQMTFEGRNFDIAVGLTAPMVAFALHRGWIGRRALGLWHLTSLALLINIVATAAMSFPGPMRVFREGASAAVVAEPPFIWLPTFLVPVALASHILALWGLRKQA